jgi:hypothetical protein
MRVEKGLAVKHQGQQKGLLRAIQVLVIAVTFAGASAVPTASGGNRFVSEHGSEQRPQTTQLGQSLTRLPDGGWLLLGGRTADGSVTANAIRVDAFHETRRVLSQGLSVARAGQTATVLPDGSVLIVGGVDRAGQPIAAVERYEPGSDSFNNLGDVGLAARSGHSATLLSDGRLLIVGGIDISALTRRDVEILDTRTLQVSSAPGQLIEARTGHQAQLLPNGDVLIVGGRRSDSETPASWEIYRAASARFELLDGATAAALLEQNVGTVAPALRATLPTLDSEDVAIDSRLALRFSKPLEPSSLTDETISVMGPGGLVEVTVSAAEGGLLAFVTPKEQWFPGTQYTLFVRGAQDTEGTAIPFTAKGFRTTALKAGQSTPPPVSLARPTTKEREAADWDGELWIPTKRNLTGVWRSGQAGSAVRHQPRRKSLARARSTVSQSQVLCRKRRPELRPSRVRSCG